MALSRLKSLKKGGIGSGITPAWRDPLETTNKTSLNDVLRFLNAFSNANLSAVNKVVDNKSGSEVAKAWTDGLTYKKGEVSGKQLVEKLFNYKAVTPQEKLALKRDHLVLKHP